MKTAGAMPRADKQEAENVFQPGKLPFNVIIYILNDRSTRCIYCHLGFRLCIFGRKSTEVVLCSSPDTLSTAFNLCHYWWPFQSLPNCSVCQFLQCHIAFSVFVIINYLHAHNYIYIHVTSVSQNMSSLWGLQFQPNLSGLLLAIFPSPHGLL